MADESNEPADVEAQDSKPADAEAPDSNPPDSAHAEGGSSPPTESEEVSEEDEKLRLVTIAVLSICGAMAVLYLVAMGWSGGAVVTVAGLVAIVVGGLVSKFQYFDLESLETLRTVQNRLRASVNDFSVENTKLVANNDRLEEELVPLKESEQKLSEIAEKSGSDVKKLTGLVSENQETLDEMHEIQKRDVVQSLMQILMDVDRNEDGELSEREVKRLRNKMKNLPTIEFNEDLFERRLENHRQVSTFLNMVHEVNDDDVPQDERIFSINEDKTPEEALEEQF